MLCAISQMVPFAGERGAQVTAVVPEKRREKPGNAVTHRASRVLRSRRYVCTLFCSGPPQFSRTCSFALLATSFSLSSRSANTTCAYKHTRTLPATLPSPSHQPASPLRNLFPLPTPTCHHSETHPFVSIFLKTVSSQPPLHIYPHAISQRLPPTFLSSCFDYLLHSIFSSTSIPLSIVLACAHRRHARPRSRTIPILLPRYFSF